MRFYGRWLVMFSLFVSLATCCYTKRENYDLTIGETISYKLNGNATTGYMWEAYSLHPNIVSIKSNIQIESSAHLGIGASSTFVFNITGKKKGKTQIIFEYKRPWEKGIKPIQIDTIEVKVK